MDIIRHIIIYLFLIFFLFCGIILFANNNVILPQKEVTITIPLPDKMNICQSAEEA